jgi:hypothetical protein
MENVNEPLKVVIPTAIESASCDENSLLSDNVSALWASYSFNFALGQQDSCYKILNRPE